MLITRSSGSSKSGRDRLARASVEHRAERPTVDAGALSTRAHFTGDGGVVTELSPEDERGGGGARATRRKGKERNSFHRAFFA